MNEWTELVVCKSRTQNLQLGKLLVLFYFVERDLNEFQFMYFDWVG